MLPTLSETGATDAHKDSSEASGLDLRLILVFLIMIPIAIHSTFLLNWSDVFGSVPIGWGGLSRWWDILATPIFLVALFCGVALIVAEDFTPEDDDVPSVHGGFLFLIWCGSCAIGWLASLIWGTVLGVWVFISVFLALAVLLEHILFFVGVYQRSKDTELSKDHT